ncbi:MAG TPA: 4-hydroxyphenylacetate 3-hydroxylase C-terminal domain-containing protein, partial [Ilumatobacteraceae bacterium]|nr:4-hydroxyphenylacetate 3-hydroxylase C-terminal domain-containing protein [Ilumatobacteraceae bacterium]
SGQFQRTAAHSLGNSQAQTRFATKLAFFAGLGRALYENSGVINDPKNKARLGQLAGQCHLPEAFLQAAERNWFLDGYGVANPDHATLYAAMTMQPKLMNEIIFLLREMSGGSVIQLPSSVAAYDHATCAADIDRYIRWPNASSDERVALLNLVWDAIGSEFAGRHLQYEMFYAGDPSVVQMRSFGSYHWDRSRTLVDGVLNRSAAPT